jgi:hypothetical protein
MLQIHISVSSLTFLDKLVDRWRAGSLWDNIDQFASSLGYENAAVAIQLAMVPWESTDDRDKFIGALTGDSPKGNSGQNYVSGTPRR